MDYQITVLFADQCFLACQGMQCILKEETGFKLCGFVSEPFDLKNEILEFQPQVLVLDSKCFSVAEAANLIRENGLKTKILVIADVREKADILLLLELGATGILLKECDQEEILLALRATSKGEKFFCGKILDSLLDKAQPTSCQALKLTERELEIIQLIARGLTTTEIASRLCRSAHTISTHRKNILAKLGLKTSSELVRFAFLNGIIAA